MSNAAWKTRIVDFRVVSMQEMAGKLTHNPQNWRVHPHWQRQTMNAVLDEIGWVSGIVVNITTWNIVDGHLRYEEATTRGAESIPVVFVELTIEEEQSVLASYDSIGSMAIGDAGKLDELLAEVKREISPLSDMVRDLAMPTMNLMYAPSGGGEEETLPIKPRLDRSLTNERIELGVRIKAKSYSVERLLLGMADALSVGDQFVLTLKYSAAANDYVLALATFVGMRVAKSEDQVQNGSGKTTYIMEKVAERQRKPRR